MSSLQTFDFFTLYANISYQNLRTPLKEIIHNAFYLKMLFKLTVLVQELTYFVKHETKNKKCYTENEVISIFVFLIGRAFVVFHKSLVSLWEQTVPPSLPSFPIFLSRQVYTPNK
jgi:hypothetical protein